MFTGLVAAVGEIRAAVGAGAGLDLDVDLAGLPALPRLGDSVALSGVCCTVVALSGTVARFHLTRETLERTWLGTAAAGTRLNLESALRAGDPLGGHLVQGHVDAVGRVTGAVDPRTGGDLWVAMPSGLKRYCVEKGSITLDGVSLTIASLRDPGEARIAIIPHTAQVTTLGQRRVGDPVHVEVDVLAKYVEQMLAARFGPAGSGPESR
jgi:riboflavin synthase